MSNGKIATGVDRVYCDMKGIYKIINKINRKYYVGSSTNIHHRWWKHKRNLYKNCHPNIHLQSSWNQYKEKNFDFVVIEPMSEKVTKKEIILTEQKWLDIAKSESYKCYNLTFIAGGGDTFSTNPNKEKIRTQLHDMFSGSKNPMYGRRHTEITRKQWSIIRAGKFCGRDNPRYGANVSEETKSKIGDSNAKMWRFISPSGNTIEFKNLALFCRKNGLSKPRMWDVSHSKLPNYKGWRLAV